MLRCAPVPPDRLPKRRTTLLVADTPDSSRQLGRCVKEPASHTVTSILAGTYAWPT